MNQAIISIGSNVFPEEHVQKAFEKAEKKFDRLETSSFQWTRPILGATGDYYNGLWRVDTSWGLEELKLFLKSLEKELGRHPGDRDRIPIDLDIIVWNQQVIDAQVYGRSYLKDLLKEFNFEI